MKSISNHAQGFTLIELTIAIAIVGISAAIALPMYQDYIARSQVAEGFTLSEDVKKVVASNFAIDKSCPSNKSAAVKNLLAGQIKSAEHINGKYVTQVETGAIPENIKECGVLVTFKANGVNTKIANKKVRFELKQNSSASQWECKSDLDDSVRPKVCNKQNNLSLTAVEVAQASPPPPRKRQPSSQPIPPHKPKHKPSPPQQPPKPQPVCREVTEKIGQLRVRTLRDTVWIANCRALNLTRPGGVAQCEEQDLRRRTTYKTITKTVCS